MIEFVNGNIINANTEALVNTVNTKGVMGKGIALQFKKAFPEVFLEYKAACNKGLVKVGEVNICKRNSTSGPRIIINFPTKDDWRKPSKIEYIKNGLKSLVQTVIDHHIQSIAIPALGCGLGGLKWNEVLPLIQAAFERTPNISVMVYPPKEIPSPQDMPNKTNRPKMTPTRAIVLQLFKQYCVLGYELSLLEAQKLLYFLQESGEPLKLRFDKYTYGPYADNLRHVLSMFEGHFIIGFGDGRNNPSTPIKILPEALKEADDYLTTNFQDNNDYTKHLSKVSNLIIGFESPYGLELLSTVHWLIKHESIPSDNTSEIIKQVQKWSPRKKRIMKTEHIFSAIQKLRINAWI